MAAGTGSASGIRAGRAYVELFADDSKLIRGLNRAKAHVETFGKSIGRVGDSLAGFGGKLLAGGAAIAVPLLAAARSFAKTGDDLNDLSKITGMTVETLSALGYAAQLSGGDMQTLASAVRFMQKAIVNGDDALEKLGLGAKELQALSPDQQFLRLADRIAGVVDPAERAALAMEVFGRGGAQLLPLLSEGSKGIEAMMAEARRLGLVMSEVEAKGAAKLADALDALTASVRRAVVAIGATLAPVITRVATWITTAVASVTQWIQQNQALFPTILMIAGAVAAAGAAFLALGLALKVIGAAIASLGTLVGVAVLAFKALGVVVGFLLTPLGAMLVLAASLGIVIAHATGAAGLAVAWLSKKFGELYDFASRSLRGIGDALAAGDIALAAQVLWLSLKVAWISGTNYLKSVWLEFRDFFIRLALDAFHALQASWEIVGNWLVVAWTELSAFSQTIWTKTAAAFKSAWGDAVNWTAKRILELWAMFDEDIDATEGARMLDSENQARKRAIEIQKQADLQAIEKDRAGKRQDAEQIRQTELAAIGQKSLDLEAKLRAAREKDSAEAQGELEKAQREWEAALAEARKRRLEGAGGPEAPGLPPLPELPSVRELQTTIKQTVTQRGTFSAFEIARTAAGGVEGAQERLARGVEQTARNTRDIADASRNGLAFG